MFVGNLGAPGDIGFHMGVRCTDTMFDKPCVERMVEKRERRFLSKFGAFVRQRARKTLRRAPKRGLTHMSLAQRQERHIAETYWAKSGRTGSPPFPKVHSKPGHAPYIHDPAERLRAIWFAYDPGQGGVVIGPFAFKQARYRAGTTPVPAILEHGGYTETSNHKRRVRIDARPFMQPSFEAELTQVDRIWNLANSDIDRGGWR